MIPDTVNAFVPDCTIPPADAPEGLLQGLTFGLKDMFDLAGVLTGAGNPDWRRTHPAPSRTAPAAARLLDAGAVLVGKTITDELAWDLDGRNAHYGTPTNIAAPGRMPGGSSSGSAAAVAAGLCAFALGTDTGGSVRLPASFCGLYGVRPTHNRIPSLGVVPLARSFDTVGWFARDPRVLRAVGQVLFGAATAQKPVRRLLIADDLFALAYPETREALAPAVERLARLVGRPEPVRVAGGDAERWREAFRMLQAHEAWVEHRDWIARADPEFGTDFREQLETGEHLDLGEVERASAVREEVRARMAGLVPVGTWLILPSAPGIAPLLGISEDDLQPFHDRAHAMLCPAGHAGLPQISLPLASTEGCPVGLSMIAACGQDEGLLDLACRLEKTA
ncbi:MAG: amidase [Methylorubrum extorquens]|jgi:amidase|uniref:amidase n=1 Tax=Methylorubrum extorquens TaxID=408 RepID=UPI002FEE0814